MSDTFQIYCENLKRYINVRGGETLLEIYERLADEIDVKPICAHVNNKTEGFSYSVFKPKKICFIDERTPSGQRVYVRSLSMVLAKAVYDLYPKAQLVIEHSISKGYYCQLKGCTECDVEKIKQRMQEITAADYAFEYNERLTTDVIPLFEQQGMADKVSLLSSLSDLYTVYYRLDNFVDSFPGCLAPSTRYVSVFDLVKYQEGMLLLPADFAGDKTQPAKMVKQEKLFKAFTDYIKFNEIVGVSNVGMLNKVVDGKNRSDVDMLINVAETLHDKMIGRIADTIAERYRKGGARVVLIAGPSSSGKTTTTKRLSIHLLANLIKPQMISLDNYFVERDKTPRDENGDYDYESLYALDIEQFNKDLNALIRGEEVAMPTYDFATGKRVYKGNKLKLTDNTILLMEGIHGLNPELTKSIPDEQKFKVYVSALTTLSIDNHNWVPTTDNRLLRRIIRDYKYRGTSALDTIARWQSVRRGEEKWIFPYQENADAMFNSSLIFELGVMKDFAEPILKKVPHDVPEYAEAYRLLAFLRFFKEIGGRQVPSTSLLREFLGGSSFKY